MALNEIIISNCNPVPLYKVGEIPDARYNSRFFDVSDYEDTILEYEQKTPYCQPWQKSDTVVFHILANYAPHVVELWDADEIVRYASVPLAYVPSSIESSGLKVYQASMPLAIYPEGCYRFLLKSGVAGFVTHKSQIQDIVEKLPLSVFMEYWHDENDYDCVFENGLKFGLRVPGGVVQYQPQSERTVFIDQPNNITQLSSRTFQTYKHVCGEAKGMADYHIAVVNDAYGCAFVYLDGRQFVAVDGAKPEPTREEEYKLVGWTIDVRPAKASLTRRDQSPAPDPVSSVVYNIENNGFGYITVGTNSYSQIIAATE